LTVLAQEITSAAVRMAAATAAWLRLIAEFDEREGWAGYGVRSCAHWLAWQCGMSPGTAREHVRVARALPVLPLISAAFEAGRLSFSKVRALTRIADPHTEADLLEFALEATASQTERTVRQWRRADSVDDESVAARQLCDWWDDDGMLVLTVRMNPDEGAPLVAAIESLAERAARRERAEATRRAAATTRMGSLPAAGRAADEDQDEDEDEDAAREHELDEVALARERTTARRCTALATLAEAAVAQGRRPGDPPRREMVVHVDADLLDDDAAAGRAYLEGGPPLHPRQVRRMLCEATVVTMLERDREVLAVGRRRRLATRPQRRALLRRDGGCARPGCTEHRIERLHAHHMRHWLHGGGTDLANLVLLCDADHGLAHDLGLVMTRRDGRLIVTAPDGRRVWGPADAAFTRGLEAPAFAVEAIADEAADEADDDADDDADIGSSADTGDSSFAGVHPIDAVRGRRPGPRRDTAGSETDVLQEPDGAEHRRPATVSTLLFPAGEPELPEAMPVNGERMDLRYVVGVLMGNRDLTRRLEAETGLPPGAAA
jgi:hypothetical protein